MPTIRSPKLPTVTRIGGTFSSPINAFNYAKRKGIVNRSISIIRIKKRYIVKVFKY